jgi:hypothetical protein
MALLALGAVWSPTPANADPVTITFCKAKREHPHHSGHFSGTINAVARVISCGGEPVPDLHLDVRLVRLVHGQWLRVPTKRKVLPRKGNLIRISRSTDRCVTGWYATQAQIFAFGTHGLWRRGEAVYIYCGMTGGAGGGGGGSW